MGAGECGVGGGEGVGLIGGAVAYWWGVGVGSLGAVLGMCDGAAAACGRG